VSGGGGNTTTVQKSDPPAYLQPFLTDIAQTAYRNSQTPPAFFPGATFLGPTQGQLDAYAQQFDYTNSVFGGARAPSFSEATGALSDNLTGRTGLGQFTGGITPLASQSLQQGFSMGPNFDPSKFTPSVNYDPNAFTSTLAGSGPTAAAYSRALSGTPDYAGLQGSIDAANAPILRQFNEEFLPQLSQRAAFLGNPTGGIKALNKVLPQLGQQLGENALRATEGERQRALAEQLQTAQFLTGAGLQGAQTGAGLGLQGYGLGLQGASQNAGVQDAFRGQALGLGQLAGGFQGQLANNQLQGISQFGDLSSLGASPGQLSAQFADFGRGFQQQALDDQIARFNYYQNLPNQSLGGLVGLINPQAGFGGVQTNMGPGGSRAGGALGGALGGAASGAAIGSVVPGIGTAIGAIGGGLIGGLGGYFGSR
jgi:hypothetical protein